MTFSMRSLAALFVRFFRIGAFTIGGGLAMLGIVESEMRSEGKFSDEEISDMIVLATAVPGPIATNLAFLAGKKMSGLPGALVAVVGTVLAPFLCILFLSGLIMAYLDTPWLKAFFSGATAGIVVLVGGTLWTMIRTSVLKGWPEIAAFSATVVLVLPGGVHPFIGLVVGALVFLASDRLMRDKGKAS